MPRISRHVTLRRQLQGLEAREPALVNLPVPVPSIPIVNKIVTPLIAGPAPAATSPSNNGGGSGGSSGGGSSGNNSGSGNSGSSGSGSSSGGGGSSNGGGSSGSSGNSSGNASSNSGGGGNTSNASESSSSSPNSGSSTGNSNSSGGQSDGSKDSGQNQSSGTSGSVDPASSSSSGNLDSGNPSNGVNVPSSTSSTSSTSDSDMSLSPLVNAAVATATGQSGSGALGATGLRYTTDAHGSTIALSPTSVSIASGGMNPSDPNTSSGAADDSASKKGGLSSGGIAGIVVSCLVLLLLMTACLLRKRSISKRNERRRFWFTRYAKSASNVADAGSSRNSARSSFGTFGTSWDRSTMSQSHFQSSDSSLMPPAAPAMAEVRGGQPLFAISPDSPTLPRNFAQAQTMAPLISTVESMNGGAAIDLRRSSVFSVGSLSSDDHSQFNTEHPPLTPTYSAFPQPPLSPNSPDHNQYAISSPTSATALTCSPIPSVPGNHTSQPATGFKDVEVVLRPFVPTLADEVGAHVGDQVRVKQLFDDGWVAVEKTRNGATESGMIPVDCLRSGEEALPAFLAAKRISSCYTVAPGLAGPSNYTA